MADEQTRQVAIRLSEQVIARIDAFAAETAPPGVTLSRSDAIRALVELGLGTVETPKSKRKR